MIIIAHLGKRFNTDGGFRGEDMVSILHYVNNEVSHKEGSFRAGELKQMPEVKFTLRKRLVLSPPTKAAV